MTAQSADDARERDDLVETLDAHRGFLRHTVRNLTEEQARRRTTVSELSLAGVLKHVTAVERQWRDFIVDGPEAMGAASDDAIELYLATFKVLEEETLEVLLRRYEDVARDTDKLVRSLPSLDDSQPLPPAPWFEPGSRRTARRTFLHIIAETAQHAGHADIIRESLDGQKTMG
jgi:uncharacterized damage-inducible protein DinB